MKSVHMLWGCLAVGLFLGLGAGLVIADGSSGARNTDSVVKEWVDEFEDIHKKKPTYAGKDRQLELIRKMEFGPCNTANRFLLDLLKAKKTPGDQRLYALRSLLRMADKKTFGKMLGVLSKAKDDTLWHVFGQEVLVRPSGAIREWANESALKSRDPQMLAAALGMRTLRPDPVHTKAIEKLFKKHAKEKGNVDLAFHALKALARLQPKVLIPQLAEAVSHSNWQLRLAAADVIPTLQPFDEAAEAATKTLIQDEAPIVQRAAIENVGKFRRTTLTALLISKLNDSVARTRHVAVQALQTMTGQKFGHDAKAWAKWQAKEAPGTPIEIETPKYHGIEIHSDYVVFVVDASSSMTWPWEQDTHRIDIALAELKNTLSKLSPKTLFNVVVFSESSDTWRPAGLSATPQNTAAASAWAETAMNTPKGDTFFYEAINTAMNLPDCDTIFLLTDGNPTAGKYWTLTGITASVHEWNRYKRIAINTVGLSLLNMDRGRPNLTEKPAVMKSMMAAIASATSGVFREVLDAPK